MKKTKKFLSFLLCIVMMLGLMPTTVFAAESETTPTDQTPVCVCETICTETNVNGECPVCSNEGADLNACTGKATEVTAEQVQAMSDEDKNAVYDQVQAVYDAFEKIPAEEQAKVEITRIEALFNFFNGQIMDLEATNCPFVIEGGTEEDYSWNGAVLTIKKSGLTISNVEPDTPVSANIQMDFSLFDPSTLTLKGVNILTPKTISNSALSAAWGLTINLAEGTTNILKSEGDEKYGQQSHGIFVADELTISGQGKLQVEACGKDQFSIGIRATSINITGGTVTVKGQTQALGTEPSLDSDQVVVTEGAWNAKVMSWQPIVHVSGVTLEKNALSLTVDESTTLTSTVAPTNATNKSVTWSSSDTSVATVDGNGKVTALKAGEATITVTTTDGSKKADCTVTVNLKSQTPPTAEPTIKSHTENSITLNDVADSEQSGAAAEYSKDGGTSWQDSPTFTNLTNGTEYTFAVRYKEEGNFGASEKSPVLKAAIPHDFNGAFDGYDEKEHWHICNEVGCNATDEAIRHFGGTATYFKKAECTECGQTYGSFAEDTTDPQGEIQVKDDKWTSFWNKLTLGKFFKETQTVTITGSDDSEKIEGYDKEKHAVKIQYYCGDKLLTLDEIKALSDADWKNYTASFRIDPNKKYVVYAKITDHSKNTYYLSTEEIVLDNIVPEITGIEDGKTYCGAVTVTVSDAYFDKVDVADVPDVPDTRMAKVTVDGENVPLTEETFTVYPKEGKQKITVSDKAGNETSYTITVNDGHTPKADDGDCTTPVICEVCHEIVKDAKTHDFTGEWKMDEAGHWHECQNDGCNVLEEKKDHTFVWKIDKEAEVGVSGSKHQECNTCHYVKEAVTIPAKPTKTTTTTKTAQTGDHNRIWLWAALLAVSGAGCIGAGAAVRKRRRR